MKRIIKVAVAVGLAFSVSAHAQIPVTDVANLIQNTLNEANTLETTVNQATQITNELTQIANQVKNLQQMPSSVASQLLGNYTTEMNQLTTAMGNIGGLANNIQNLSSNYNGLYPAANGQQPMTTQQLLSQVQGWLTQANKDYQGAYSAQGQVIAALPQQAADVASAANQSQASTGALSAIQAGNQIQTQVAQQLIQLNGQMAAINQAQTDIAAQQAEQMKVSDQAEKADAAGLLAEGNVQTQPVGQPALQ